MSDWTYTHIDPRELRDHEANAEIYGEHGIDDDMLASVKEFGILEPLRCTKDNVVLSGHRRRQHAIEAKLKTVPVMRRKLVLSEPEQILHIVESNRQRVKDFEQRAREVAKCAEAKAQIAREQMLSGRKKDPLLKKVKGVAPSQENSSLAQAAAEAGMGRDTAEKAIKVVKKIDQLKASGKTEEANELRDTLNKGNVSAAARKAGVIPPKPAAKPAPPAPEYLPLADALAELDACLKEIKKQWPPDELGTMAAKLRKFAESLS